MKYKNQKLKELFSFNKVITLLKIKSASEFAVFLIGGAIERADSIAKSHSVALSRLRLQLETLQLITADLIFKSVINLLKLNSSFRF